MSEVAAGIARRAADLVAGDRAQMYGDPTENYRKVAAVWNGILDAAGMTPAKPIDAMTAATMMEGLKIARRYLGPYERDSFVDSCGYAAVAGEIAAKEKK